MIVKVIKRAKVMAMKATGKMEEVRMLKRTKSQC